MVRQRNHYTALGLTADADQEVIQAAFRALAKKYHPIARLLPVLVFAR